MTKYIPDCFWPEHNNGFYVSHEAVCVLNPHQETAFISLTLFFEDRPKMTGFDITVPGERTKHIRLDKLFNTAKEPIPKGVPYAMMIESDIDIAVQYTRVDTTQAELAIATTII